MGVPRICKDCGREVKPRLFTKDGRKHKKPYYNRSGRCEDCAAIAQVAGHANAAIKRREQREVPLCTACGNPIPITSAASFRRKTCSGGCADARVADSMTAMNGKPLVGKYAAGVDHPYGKAFQLRSPDGVDYVGVNLRHFVRTHPQLFPPESLIEQVYVKPSGRKGVRSGMRASTGLSAVQCGRCGSWKGWTKSPPSPEAAYS